MKKNLFTITVIVLFYSTLSFGQIVTQCKGTVNPSNKLWEDYNQDISNPSKLPDIIPIDVNYSGLVKKEINPNYDELKNAVLDLAANKGGVISFKNVGSGKTIFFDEAIEITNDLQKPCITILIEGNNQITFDGGNKSSMFVLRKSVKVIIQNTTFQRGRLKRNIIQDPSKFRVGGGAIEATFGAALRVYGCTFINNNVDEWDDTPGGGYDGVGENQNGAAIRLNFHTTGEIFKSTFENNKAVTGGAVGATSINKLTIMDSFFDKNVSTAYNTKNSTKRRIAEGAGALRVDRTAKPLEIYRTRFSENAANKKASVMEVFIRPLRDKNGKETGPYPNLSQFALIIDGCTFEKNKYYNFKGANDPERGDFFAGCMVFHGGRKDNNFKGAKMKITNSSFIENEVAESNIRALMDFELSNSIFANTNFIRLKDNNNNYRNTGKAALMLRGEVDKGLITNCTFYNNETHPDDPDFAIASDLFFWKGTENNFTLNNSIFYRKNKKTTIKQVSQPIKGSGNNQFIPGVDMATFSSVSTSSVNLTDPNITPNNIVDMCLGQNSLPKNIGGLDDCGASGGNSGSSPAFTIPGTIQVESFITKSGSVRIENTPGTSNKNLGYIKDKDFTEYEVNIASTGDYRIDAYVSSNGAIGKLQLLIDNKNAGVLETPVNNAWHKYEKVSKTRPFTAGKHRLKLLFKGTASGFLYNIDRIVFTKVANAKQQSIGTSENNQITAYPNPTKGFIQIQGDQNISIQNVDIYTLDGILIDNLKVNSNGYDISNLSKGMYILKYTFKNKTTQKETQQISRIIKQ